MCGKASAKKSRVPRTTQFSRDHNQLIRKLLFLIQRHKLCAG